MVEIRVLGVGKPEADRRYQMGTVIVLIALGVIIVLIVRSMIKDKKNGKSSCGGDCSRCKGCH